MVIQLTLVTEGRTFLLSFYDIKHKMKFQKEQTNLAVNKDQSNETPLKLMNICRQYPDRQS